MSTLNICTVLSEHLLESVLCLIWFTVQTVLLQTPAFFLLLSVCTLLNVSQVVVFTFSTMFRVSVMQVLIQVHACGVNPVETYIRSGSFARKPTLPYTPGADVSGVVEAVGEEVTAVKVKQTLCWTDVMLK